MRDRRAVSLVLVLLVAFGSLAATFAVGNSPALGLDLQGGASVVLQPPPGTPTGTLDQAIEIIQAAEANGWGPLQHRHVLHDRASFRYFWHVIERASQTGQLPVEIQQRWFGDATAA